MKVTSKNRETNFELLRIIAMLFIVGSHYVIHGQIQEIVRIGSFNQSFLGIIRFLAGIGVNLYVLITGYYMIFSKIKLKKTIKMWFSVVFYSLAILVIYKILGNNIGIKDVIKSIMPICSELYWFVTVYIAMYMLTPFINKLIKNLEKRQYLILITILFIFLVFIKTIFIDSTSIESQNGASLIWFIYLYLVAGYIRLYYKERFNKNIYLFGAILITIIVAIIRFISIKYLGKEMTRLITFNNIFAFIGTICIFIFFKNIKIQNRVCNKIIGIISPLTFGVYLIHENPYINNGIWNLLHTYRFANSQYLILHFTISIILVFTICSIIEYIRIKMFAIIENVSLIKKVYEKIDKINEKFWKIMEEK